MARNPGITMNIHVKDDTKFEAQRIPSTDTDFVALKMGWDVGVLMFTSAQAKALAEAADEAYFALRAIEDEKERQARAASRVTEYTYVNYDEDGSVNCTIENPCEGCRDEHSNYNNCTMLDPCDACREADNYDYEPF